MIPPSPELSRSRVHRWQLSLAAAFGLHVALAYWIDPGSRPVPAAEPLQIVLSEVALVSQPPEPQPGPSTTSPGPRPQVERVALKRRVTTNSAPKPTTRRLAATRKLSRDPSSSARAFTDCRGPEECASSPAPALSGASGQGLPVSNSYGTLTGSGRGEQSQFAARKKEFSRPAQLRTPAAGCRDLFPYQAHGDQGVATVSITVSASGDVLGVQVVNATPIGDGFESAAMFCAKRLGFRPALDRLGRAVSSKAQVRLSFERG